MFRHTKQISALERLPPASLVVICVRCTGGESELIDQEPKPVLRIDYDFSDFSSVHKNPVFHARSVTGTR